MFKTKEIRHAGDVVREAMDRRLHRHGAKALAEGELLAIILGGGSPRSLSAAAGLLARYGSLETLGRADPVMLSRTPGMGPALGRRLAAAFELGQRFCGLGQASGHILRGPEDVAPILQKELRGCDREHFLALHLDVRHRLRLTETVSIGSLSASLVHPREVFRRAVSQGTAALIVAHNHPSGCVEPSREDIELTARLSECGRLMGIELLDHFIVGAGDILSLREYGWPGNDA
jgi:DNA repair protein RadC